MKLKNIHFIINPVSGKEERGLFFINHAFSESDIDWEVSVIKKSGSAGDMNNAYTFICDDAE